MSDRPSCLRLVIIMFIASSSCVGGSCFFHSIVSFSLAAGEKHRTGNSGLLHGIRVWHTAPSVIFLDFVRVYIKACINFTTETIEHDNVFVF